MARYRSAWGILRAVRMRGVDDRGDFYHFWYHAWALEPGERPLAGWWVAPVVESPVAQRLQNGGNLVLTDRRLLWEPAATGRSAFGQHGTKLVLNLLAAGQDKLSPRTPMAWRLGTFSLNTTESSLSPVWIVDGSGRRGFYFARAWPAQDRLAERTRFIARIDRQHEGR